MQAMRAIGTILNVRFAILVLSIGVLAISQTATSRAQSAQSQGGPGSGRDYKHDTSNKLTDIPPKPYVGKQEHEANRHPRPISQHTDEPEAAAQTTLADPAMPSAGLNFDGIAFPGVNCNCAPPDTNGEVGSTQYVQIVNEGFQVFNKSTGASVFGPVGISTLWSGFGGVCENNGSGDPVLMYDQLANRWIISQFAGASQPTDECIAVSTTSDATGSYHRYAFHLGSNFFDYPKLAVWPDAYYMAMNVFNAAGTAYLGPQPFAFNRTAMLTGSPASFVTTGITGGSGEETYLPADLDGTTLPPAGAPNTFVEYPDGGVYKLYHFHADFATPANSTFTLFATLPVAGFTQLCPTTLSCVPQGGAGSKPSRLDGIGDRLMFRAAYRNLGDHESLVTNYSVSSGGVAGVRWLEFRNVTFGPITKYQESTYQPDTTWRWMGSAAMDGSGNLAVGFSASSADIHPQLRYAGRLATDPLNTLAQGEATLFAGTGSQRGTSSRWGDYSALTVDPVDDCTFWYTNEYYQTTGSFNWRTRIGTFKFPQCNAGLGTLQGTVTDSATSAPIDGASVQISGGFAAASNASGFYTKDLPQGTYDVTFSKAGYVSQTINNVVVNTGATTTQDAALDPAPPTPSLSIVKTADAAGVPNGSQIGFTVTVTNSGSGSATGLSVSDNLPGGTGVTWSIDAANSSAGWSIGGAPPNQTLSFGPASLAGGSDTHVHVVSATTSQSCGTYNNTASFTSGNGGSGSSSQASVVVTCGGAPVALITTSNSCTAFTAGTATPLSVLNYAVNTANGITSVAPSAFYYWVTVTAATGNNTFVIPQAITTGNFSTLFQQGISAVLNSACGTVSGATFTQTPTNATSGTVSAAWNAPAAGTYYIRLQLSAANLIKKIAPNPTTVHYDFSTNGVAGSAKGVDLVKQ
jgi:uncharacterized repeat protein (TIGR01451 family)